MGGLGVQAPGLESGPFAITAPIPKPKTTSLALTRASHRPDIDAKTPDEFASTIETTETAANGARRLAISLLR